MGPSTLSIRAKVVGSVVLASVAFVLASVLLVEGPLQALLQRLLAEEQTRNALRLADDVAHVPSGLAAAPEVCTRAAKILDRRVTIIAPDGVVVADTARDPGTLENHLGRPELVEARQSPRGAGTAVRTSASTGLAYLYVAVRIEQHGRFLGWARIATSLDEVEARAVRVRRSVLAAAILAALLAVPVGAIGATLTTRKLSSMARVAEEIGHGELGRRIDVPGTDEVGRLGQAVNLLAERLEEKLVRLTRDRGLFLAVLDAIGEGVAFVDPEDRVLATNGAFRRFLGPGVVAEGLRLRDLVPDAALETAVRRALEGGTETRAEALLGEPAQAVRFRVIPTPIANVGTVALLITDDLTPNPRLEAMRGEAASVLARSLALTNAPLPREAQLALELTRAAALLDEHPAKAEVVLLNELLPRLRAADEAPALFVVRERAMAAVRLLRLELALRDEEPFPVAIEVMPAHVALALESGASRESGWAVPRSSEGFGVRLRVLARRLALAHLEAAGAEVEDHGKKLVVRVPRA